MFSFRGQNLLSLPSSKEKLSSFHGTSTLSILVSYKLSATSGKIPEVVVLVFSSVGFKVLLYISLLLLCIPK